MEWYDSLSGDEPPAGSGVGMSSKAWQSSPEAGLPAAVCRKTFPLPKASREHTAEVSKHFLRDDSRRSPTCTCKMLTPINQLYFA